jgi:hypothetical protein
MPPLAAISFATDSSASTRLAANPTRAPRCAKSNENRLPNPLEAPVTSATLSRSPNGSDDDDCM